MVWNLKSIDISGRFNFHVQQSTAVVSKFYIKILHQIPWGLSSVVYRPIAENRQHQHGTLGPYSYKNMSHVKLFVERRILSQLSIAPFMFRDHSRTWTLYLVFRRCWYTRWQYCCLRQLSAQEVWHRRTGSFLHSIQMKSLTFGHFQETEFRFRARGHKM